MVDSVRHIYLFKNFKSEYFPSLEDIDKLIRREYCRHGEAKIEGEIRVRYDYLTKRNVQEIKRNLNKVANILQFQKLEDYKFSIPILYTKSVNPDDEFYNLYATLIPQGTHKCIVIFEDFWIETVEEE